MTNGEIAQNPGVALSRALSLVFKALAVAHDGLLLNPSREEERQLNETILDLEAKRAMIRASLDALASNSRVVAGPTSAQVREVSRLTGQVEALTTANLTASAAVSFTSKVLTVASEVTSGRPVTNRA